MDVERTVGKWFRKINVINFFKEYEYERVQLKKLAERAPLLSSKSERERSEHWNGA